MCVGLNSNCCIKLRTGFFGGFVLNYNGCIRGTTIPRTILVRKGENLTIKEACFHGSEVYLNHYLSDGVDKAGVTRKTSSGISVISTV